MITASPTQLSLQLQLTVMRSPPGGGGSVQAARPRLTAKASAIRRILIPTLRPSRHETGVRIDRTARSVVSNERAGSAAVILFLLTGLRARRSPAREARSGSRRRRRRPRLARATESPD